MRFEAMIGTIAISSKPVGQGLYFRHPSVIISQSKGRLIQEA